MNRVPKFFRERRVRNILESYRKGWFYKTSGPRYTAMGYGMMCAVILISVTQSVKIDTKIIKFTIISLCSSSKSAASSFCDTTRESSSAIFCLSTATWEQGSYGAVCLEVPAGTGDGCSTWEWQRRNMSMYAHVLFQLSHIYVISITLITLLK